MNEQNNNFNTPSPMPGDVNQTPVVNTPPVAPAPMAYNQPPVNNAGVTPLPTGGLGEVPNNNPAVPPVAPVTPVAPVPPVAPVVPVAPEVQPEPEDKPKKKVSPIVIIALILVLLVGGVAGYYFLLETPQKIFAGAYDKLLPATGNTGLPEGYTKYDLKLNITADAEMFKTYADVINNISISGTSGYEASSKVYNTKNTILYKNNELINFDATIDVTNTILYVKANDLFDKVLMLKSDDTSTTVAKDIDKDVDDYVIVKDGVLTAIERSLDTADYKKELAELNGARVTKSTLYVNKKLANTFYDTLLQDSNFLTAFASVTNETVESVKKDLEDEKSNIKDENVTIEHYTSLIKKDLL